ncbi:tetratricopeptide repeat protein [Thermodesulfobacteriota bacterium]
MSRMAVVRHKNAVHPERLRMIMSFRLLVLNGFLCHVHRRAIGHIFTVCFSNKKERQSHMKKRKCALCSRTKARRKCSRNNHEFICSQCCAESRDSACEGCQHFTESRRYHLSKNPTKMKKHFIVEINEEVEQTVDDALALVEGGNIRKGERILEELSIRHSKNYMVNYGIGVVNAFKEDYDKAIEFFTRATDAFPYFIEAHFNKAVAYKSKLDIKNAVRSFQEVIQIGDPQTSLVRQAREFVSGLETVHLKPKGLRWTVI